MITIRKLFFSSFLLLLPFTAYTVTPKKALSSSTLLEASKKGDVSLMKKLLGFANIAINITNENGVTPLMLTSWAGFETATHLLLEYGANANLQTKNNKDFDLNKLLAAAHKKSTALMLACAAGAVSIVKDLIKHGADLNAQDSAGQTALMYAILASSHWPDAPLTEKRKEIVEILINAGADARICDNFGRDAIYFYSAVAALKRNSWGYDSDQEMLENDPIYKKMIS